MLQTKTYRPKHTDPKQTGQTRLTRLLRLVIGASRTELCYTQQQTPSYHAGHPAIRPLDRCSNRPTHQSPRLNPNSLPHTISTTSRYSCNARPFLVYLLVLIRRVRGWEELLLRRYRSLYSSTHSRRLDAASRLNLELAVPKNGYPVIAAVPSVLITSNFITSSIFWPMTYTNSPWALK
ncbi:hypothetical protein F5B17DRAFT_405918 [Nemania serpens]|nr:hypothetical protein F5B17DRAFT_405918 [Nemania serpens]